MRTSSGERGERRRSTCVSISTVLESLPSSIGSTASAMARSFARASGSQRIAPLASLLLIVRPARSALAALGVAESAARAATRDGALVAQARPAALGDHDVIQDRNAEQVAGLDQ